MKIEDVKKLANQSLGVDSDLLDDESLRTISLQTQWAEILHEEELILYKYRKEVQQMRVKLTNYYRGRMTRPELEELGRPQFLDALSKAELETHLEADEEFAKVLTKVHFQTQKIDLIKGYIDAIRQRTWAIKNAIEYRRFIRGT